MTFSQLTRSVSLVLLASCALATTAADHHSIDKVFGSAVVASNQHYGNISVVNGSVQMASNSSAKDVSVVNGSVDIRDNVSVRSISTVNGSIDTGNALQVAGDVATVNGKILPGTHALIGGNIDSINGDIVLDNSTVDKNVSSVNGDIKLTGNTVVKGDLVYKSRGKQKSFFGWSNHNKPTLYIGVDAVVGGSIILQQQVELQLQNPAMQAKVVYQINDGS
jgi:hypothetical protein